MAMLHTVNKSPFGNDSLESCLRCAKAGSAILLIEDGVLGATEGTKVSDAIKSAMADKKVYALGADIDARGLKGKVIDGIELVDYKGFVKLTTEMDTVQSWL